MHIVSIFFLGAAMCAAVRRWYPRESGWLAAAVCLAGAVMSLRTMLSYTSGIIPLVDAWLEEFPRQVSLVFDPLSILVVTLISMVGLVAVLAEMGREEYQAMPVLLAAVGASIGAALAGELSTLYPFLLLLSLLLALGLAQKGLNESAAQFFLAVEGAGALFLVATTYLSVAGGSFTFSGLNVSQTVNALPGGSWVFLALAAAMVARAAWIPVHTWATGAAHRLSAAGATWILLLPPIVALYLLLRSWSWLIRLEPEWGATALQGLGAATVLICSYSALHQRSFRRIAAFVVLAWSGFVPLGLTTYATQGSNAALYHLISLALVGPAVFLALARLGESMRQAQPQEPLSFGLALAGVVVGIGAPATAGFQGRLALVQSLLAAPGSSILFLLTYILGTAFATLALLGVLHRVAQRGVTMGTGEQAAEELLLRPGIMALAVPVGLALLLGIAGPVWEDTVYYAALDMSPLATSVFLMARGAAWAILIALTGPGLGLILFLLNRDCASWRWKPLGIQQCSVAAPEPWWSYMERIDPYLALRLAVVGVADLVARGLELLAGRLAR